MTGTAETATGAPGMWHRYRVCWGLTVLAAGLVTAGAKAEPPLPDQANHAPPNAAALPEVTIRAQREAIEPRVRAFVFNSAKGEPSETSLARWVRPICLLVVGLTEEQKQFVRSRLSEIATAAGAHMAAEPCEANLAIVVATDPVAILKAWYKRDDHLFGDVIELRVKEFFKAPRPVYVWYNAKIEPTDKMPQSIGIPGQLGLAFSRAVGTLPSATNIKTNDVRAFTSVIVAIDRSRMQGIGLTQLTDYAAMVGLAEIHLDADVGTAPTVLRLFSPSNEAPPPGLSDWDRAYLKALYHLNLKTWTQRAQIAERIVHDLVP